MRVGLLHQLVGAPSATERLASIVYRRTFAAIGTPTAHDDAIYYSLGNTSDPEASSTLQGFQRHQFAEAKGGSATGPAGVKEAELEMAQQVERKFMRAQTVESGMQNLAVPFSWDVDGGLAALKRYVAQLRLIGRESGFASPAAELDDSMMAVTAGTESAKELLARLKPFVSPSYLEALTEAMQAVEVDTGAPVSLDGSHPGYDKFAAKVKTLAQAHRLPWQLLLSAHQKMATADEDTAESLYKEYLMWMHAAALADAKDEVADLRAAAQHLLDMQLTTSSQCVRKEQQAALAVAARKLEASRGSTWASNYRNDLEFTAWFDEAVAKNPVRGPQVAA